MKRIVEITAAEGGEDSKIFVGELFDAYQKLISKQNWKMG